MKIEPEIASGPPAPEQLSTHDGFTFEVRRADARDESALADFFTQVSQEDLRFRFLSAVQKVSQAQLTLLTHPDHLRTENYLAVEQGTGAILASAMLAADDAMDVAEAAIVIRSDHKGRGIGWRLLRHLGERAAAMGLRSLQSIESRENRAAIDVELEMGFVSRPCPGDATLLILEKALAQQPEAALAASS